MPALDFLGAFNPFVPGANLGADLFKKPSKSIGNDIRKILGFVSEDEKKRYKETGKKLFNTAEKYPWDYTMNKAIEKKTIENIGGNSNFLVLVIGVLIVLILSD